MIDNNEELNNSASLELVVNIFRDIVNGLATQFEDRIKNLENTVENIEKQIATLVFGYGEQAVFMEALVGQIAYSSDEAREAFHKQVNSARREMVEVINSASKGLLADQDSNLASAIADVATEKLSDPTV